MKAILSFFTAAIMVAIFLSGCGDINIPKVQVDPPVFVINTPVVDDKEEELRAQIAELQAQIDALTAQLDAANAQLEAERSAKLQAQIAALQAQIAALNAQLEAEKDGGDEVVPATRPTITLISAPQAGQMVWTGQRIDFLWRQDNTGFQTWKFVILTPQGGTPIGSDVYWHEGGYQIGGVSSTEPKDYDSFSLYIPNIPDGEYIVRVLVVPYEGHENGQFTSADVIAEDHSEVFYITSGKG